MDHLKDQSGSSIADRFERQFNDLIDDMRDERMHCYEDENGNHYIQFGDGSVITEPDSDAVAAFKSADEWEAFVDEATVTECGHTTPDEQATSVLKAAVL
jgi:hypothetical protein